MDGFSTRMELRIDWSEVDSFGHVNNLMIMRYVQTARVNYLEAIGMMQAHAETGIGPVLASTACQFKKQLIYPGRVFILSKIESVKNTSFHMKHVVLDEAEHLIAEAHDVLVMFNYRKNCKQAVPLEFREKIQALENPPILSPLKA